MGGWWIYFFRRIEWHSLGKDKTRARQADLGLRTRRLGPMLSARRWSQCRYDWRLESEYIKVMRRILTDYINRIHGGKSIAYLVIIEYEIPILIARMPDSRADLDRTVGLDWHNNIEMTEEKRSSERTKQGPGGLVPSRPSYRRPDPSTRRLNNQ